MNQYNDLPMSEIPWTKYKIVVPTINDKLELEQAFKHIHDSDVDTNYVVINQLAHEYLTPELTGNLETRNNIIVDPELYQKLSITSNEQH